jgi:hypothetical protein
MSRSAPGHRGYPLMAVRASTCSRDARGSSDDRQLMPSAELSRRVGKVVGYPPLSDMGDLQRREFHEALLEAATFEDLPGKWQAAIPAEAAGRHERLARCLLARRRGVVFGRAQQPPFRPVWVFFDARNLERRHTRSEGTSQS